MTYTQEEQQLIEYAARKLYPIILEDDWDKNKQYREEFESAFHSIAMQKILDKRIIAAKIEVLREVAKEYHNNSFSNAFTRATERKFKTVDIIILDKLNELKK